MYEVTTTLKTLLRTADLAEAMEVAREAAKATCYVEVKVIITEAPWRTESVAILSH